MRAGNLNELLEMYGEEVVKAIRHIMEAEAESIVRDMKARAPVRTGKLRASIHWKWNRDKTVIKIVADAKNEKGFKYARIVEFSPKINKPFFYPVMDAHRDEYRQKLKNALREAVRKAGK